MKLLSFVLTSLALIHVVPAQTPLAPADALARLYHGYDAKTKTSQWICGDEKGRWDCTAENRAVQVDLMIEAEVWEGGTAKSYIVGNAKPKNYDCHACAPALGVAVFAWDGDRWQVESSNRVVGFYGAFGEAPEASIVKTGFEHSGVLLSAGDIAQGYGWSYKSLLLPYKTSIAEAWSIDDEQDNYGAYDPTDKFAEHTRWRSSSAFRFDPVDDEDGKHLEYYDIEVISCGTDRKGGGHPIRQENWTERYRFVDGKYKLIKRTNFVEIERPAKSK